MLLSARIKRLRGKALIEGNGCSGEYAPAFSNKLHPCSVLKKKCNADYDLLSLPQGAGLETLYAALLILIREQPLSSINALLKGVSNSS